MLGDLRWALLASVFICRMRKLDWTPKVPASSSSLDPLIRFLHIQTAGGLSYLRRPVGRLVSCCGVWRGRSLGCQWAGVSRCPVGGGASPCSTHSMWPEPVPAPVGVPKCSAPTCGLWEGRRVPLAMGAPCCGCAQGEKGGPGPAQATASG